MSNTVGRRSVVGYALRPLVRYLGPASRLITPSANKLITSLELGRCTQPRIILDFRSEEGREEAQRWYEHQGRSTRFFLLEYRKEKAGQFKHEFVVVRLNNSTLCRFDRRARDGNRGDALRDEGAPAEDSAQVLSSFGTEYKKLLEESQVLLSIKLSVGEDLGVILAICEGIQTHSKALTYNLIRYNCYFFSWMLTAGVARRACNWGSNILSREGWDEILQTSLTHIFPSPITNQLGGESIPPATPSRRANMVLWTRNIIAKLRKISQNSNKPESISGQSDLEVFQDALKSQYHGSYDSLERAWSRLLLRSQLGPALRKELRRIETSSFSLAKCTVAENKVRMTVLQSATFPPILYLEFLAPGRRAISSIPHIDCYRYSQLKQATKAAAEMLPRLAIGTVTPRKPPRSPASRIVSGGVRMRDPSFLLEDRWIRAWTEIPAKDQRYEWLEKAQACVRAPEPQTPPRLKALRKWMLTRPAASDQQLIRDSRVERPPVTGWDMLGMAAMHVWKTIGHEAFRQWKATWDEYDKRSAQYDNAITTTMMATFSERLADIAPEQLSFGDNLKHGEGLDQSEQTSLQDFIRSRMQEHFEMVDKYGFGSFQELITTAEEAMCDIWVTSLDIIESNRYQS
ncbi:unnamed protein product [Rhizoctonia solani]|uniref:Uncharacterized protein n=1 Tax=Rhizoctonia solani TaxID=456999 RepID=A0A8H2XKZ9_9AGAM|nr:unnamed protein product [Rhizoctonia solani]